MRTNAPVATPVPCAARPSTGFVHLDGPCRCFVGGPPPEFPQPAPIAAAGASASLTLAPAPGRRAPTTGPIAA